MLNRQTPANIARFVQRTYMSQENPAFALDSQEAHEQGRLESDRLAGATWKWERLTLAEKRRFLREQRAMMGVSQEQRQ